MFCPALHTSPPRVYRLNKMATAPKCQECRRVFDEEEQEDELWTICYGKSTPGVSMQGAHSAAHKFCRECAFDVPDSQGNYLCDDCEARQPVISPQPSQDDSQNQSQRSTNEWEVERIESSVFATDLVFGTGDILHFEVKWKGYPSNENPFEPFYGAEAEHPEQHFYRNWRTTPPADTVRTEDEAAGNPFWARLRRGYWALCKPLAEEVLKSSTISGLSSRMRYGLNDLQAEIFEFFASIPASILASVCGAGLRSRKARDEELYAYLVNSYADSVKRPCIYMLEFTDQIGLAPTLADMLEIVRDARTYSNPQGPDDWKVAVRIDKAGGKSLTAGEREERRDDANVRSYLKSKNARRQLDQLLTTLERDIQQLTNAGHRSDQPMPWVLRDIGYTDDCRHRLRNQEQMKASSNPLMSLFNAIAHSNEVLSARAQAARPSTKGAVSKQYRLHGDVIFLCFRYEHAVIAEIMFTVLAQSYTWDGRGFNGFQAGISNSSNE